MPTKWLNAWMIAYSFRSMGFRKPILGLRNPVLVSGLGWIPEVIRSLEGEKWRLAISRCLLEFIIRLDIHGYPQRAISMDASELQWPFNYQWQWPLIAIIKDRSWQLNCHSIAIRGITYHYLQVIVISSHKNSFCFAVLQFHRARRPLPQHLKVEQPPGYSRPSMVANGHELLWVANNCNCVPWVAIEMALMAISC